MQSFSTNEFISYPREIIPFPVILRREDRHVVFHIRLILHSFSQKPSDHTLNDFAFLLGLPWWKVLVPWKANSKQLRLVSLVNKSNEEDFELMLQKYYQRVLCWCCKNLQIDFVFLCSVSQQRCVPRGPSWNVSKTLVLLWKRGLFWIIGMSINMHSVW